MRDRNRIKADYVERGMSLEEIASVWGLSLGPLQRRAQTECWQEQKMERMYRENYERIELLAGKLLSSLEQRLDEGGGIELKDYKAVTGALRELRDMHKAEEPKAAPEKKDTLTVRFAGEMEEMSL